MCVSSGTCFEVSDVEGGGEEMGDYVGEEDLIVLFYAESRIEL